MEQRTTKSEEIFRRYQDKPGSLLGILEELQESNEHHYLSEDALRMVADRTGLPLSRIYSVATFYSFFNLQPQGRHTVVVCRGTACHTRGSLSLLKEAVHRLGFPEFREEEEASFTTEDKQFTVRTVACFGQCALAPVVSIDGIIYSRMTIGKLTAILQKLGKEKAK